MAVGILNTVQKLPFQTITASPYLVAVSATALSFLRTGYRPIADNNVYHLPILLGSFDLPQFSNDPFIQSLRYFSSGFWILFSGIGRSIDPKIFLAFWLVLTHFTFLAAAVHFAKSLGCDEKRVLNLFVVLLAVASPMIGTTVGGGGIMLHYFTHSELANVSLMLGFSYALRGHYGRAALATSLTFFLNAFMAVWMILPLTFLVIHQLRNGSVRPREFVVRGATGSVIGLLFLVPPLVNVLSNPQISEPGDFSYRAYLWDFFPLHFFLESNSWPELLALAGMMLVIGLTFRQFGRQSAPFLMLCFGAFALLFAGAVLPLVSDSRLMLNLHLIRSAVMIAVLAAISLVLLTARWLLKPETDLQAVLGPILAGLLIPPIVTFPLAVLLLLFHTFAASRLTARGIANPKFWRRAAWCFLIILVIPLLQSSHLLFQEMKRIRRVSDQWERIGLWARHELPQDATFLNLPNRDPQEAVLGFEYSSERSQPFAEKFGAAVMWSPSYFEIWESSILPLRSVKTSEEKRSRARAAGIDYLGTECDPVLGPSLHQDGDMCLYTIAGDVS